MGHHPATLSHNYLEKVECAEEIAIDKFGPGKIFGVTIVHQAYCDLVSGQGFCNCDPDVSVKPIKQTEIKTWLMSDLSLPRTEGENES